MIHIRRAGHLDAGAMAEMLNAIIAKGGTTAFTQEVDRTTITAWMSHRADRSAWHIAENDQGALLGYQSIEPSDRLPTTACDIATFVALGQTGLGIGSQLFNTTRSAALGLGYHWINATIRADNDGGLSYYQSRGFETYAQLRAVQLDDGTIVDKISKRYDLRNS